MSNWRLARLSKPVARLWTIVIGAVMTIVAALALPHAYADDRDCSFFQARFATKEYPALELHFCVVTPSTGSAIVIRYDIEIHVAIVPSRPSAMNYDPIDEPSRTEFAVALSGGEPERITRALLALAFEDQDWRWVQDRCLELLTDHRIWVRRTAATCLAHLARRHRQLDVHRVIPALQIAAQTPDDRPYVETAIEEIARHALPPA